MIYLVASARGINFNGESEGLHSRARRAELEAGWYVLRLQTKEGIQTVPFVVE
ncbi:MAG: hypothetical protein R2792_19610 [Saprospiraceae bacterium]